MGFVIGLRSDPQFPPDLLNEAWNQSQTDSEGNNGASKILFMADIGPFLLSISELFARAVISMAMSCFLQFSKTIGLSKAYLIQQY